MRQLTKRIKKLKYKSGTISSKKKLVSFLYLLLRDYLPAADVEMLVLDSSKTTTSVFTNGYLALYAKDLAKQLKDK